MGLYDDKSRFRPTARQANADPTPFDNAQQYWHESRAPVGNRDPTSRDVNVMRRLPAVVMLRKLADGAGQQE